MSIMKKRFLLLTLLLFTFQGYSQPFDENMLKLLNDSLQKDPENLELLLLRGYIFYENKNYESAIIEFSNILTNSNFKNRKPIYRSKKILDSSDILKIRALCYDFVDSIEKSVIDFRYLQQIEPNDFMYSIAIARLYIKHKDFINAQNEIDKLKKHDENERGLVYQAKLYFEMSNIDDAIKAIDIALNKYPNSIEGLILKAKISIKLEQYDNACKYIGEARTKINPEYFGNKNGYLNDFVKEIDELYEMYCE